MHDSQAAASVPVGSKISNSHCGFKGLCPPVPPLQWNGGMITQLCKNKGLAEDKSSYRDAMLGDISGKSVSSLVRSRLISGAARLAGDCQFASGFNWGETAVAHVAVRLFF